MNAKSTAGLVALWLARLAAAALFLFWGAFFVEHLAEWFLREDGRFPPAWVWVAQLLHLLMLAGLLFVLVRPGWGALATILATAAFFSWIGVRSFPTIALVNLVPLALLLVAWLLRRDAEPAAARHSASSL
jgi:hypothetical protein